MYWYADRPSWGTLASAEESKDFIHPNQPVVGVCFIKQAFATYHNARLLYSDERLDIIEDRSVVYPWGRDFGRGNANTKKKYYKDPLLVFCK